MLVYEVLILPVIGRILLVCRENRNCIHIAVGKMEGYLGFGRGSLPL
jgi:hypothetical protein